MSRRVLLIDADVLAYNAAFACETATEWEPGYWTWNVAWDDVLKTFNYELDRIVTTLKADDYKLCLTDSEGNFRNAVLPSYKGSRKGVRKPIVLKAFKEYLINERGAYFKPGLEGDDCMGILATRSNPNNEERIIVSPDKDMKTIPGKFVRWGVEGAKVMTVSETDADYWHLYQTLTGDVTDGYKGLPGCGPKKAETILQDAIDRNAHLSGTMAQCAWPAVREAFEKAGLTEQNALVQARVARILRASDYNFKTKEPILWTPR